MEAVGEAPAVVVDETRGPAAATTTSSPYGRSPSTRTEVTNAQYQKYLDATRYRPTGTTSEDFG